MALTQTAFSDKLIVENYPHAMFLVEETTGEIVVCLGENENGEVCA